MKVLLIQTDILYIIDNSPYLTLKMMQQLYKFNDDSILKTQHLCT